PIIGLVIGLLILKTAYGIGKENIDNIMGKVPSEELIKDIERAANNTENVQNAHNIKVDYFGSYATVTLHVQMDGNMTLDESHKLVHDTQDNIMKEVPIVKSVVVHACPVGLNYNHDQKIDK
ncbi:MAG: cation diffusion facilitator family transporter, partial [Methanobrevibacter sp.]|nr:cation diffusion facilitator family transporter [Methanobrevibacter sp.]